MCAVRRRPSLPAQTSLPHATARRLPPRFPIGEYTGVHSAPTFSRRPFPAPSGLRAPPGLRFPRASRFRNSFPRPSPSLPSLSFALRRALPRSSPRRPAPTATRTPVFRPPATAQNLRPRDSFPVFALPHRAFPFSSRSFLHAPGKAGRITSLRLRVRVPRRPKAADFRRLHLTSPSKNHCFFTPLRPFLSVIEF